MPRALASLLLVLLAACGGGHEFGDLEQYMREVRERPAPPVKPLPEFKAYEPFAYGAAGQRSPFRAPAQTSQRAADAPEVRPDPDRPRQYLEQFTLGELDLVGTLSRAQQRHALIRDPEGVVHRVSRGQYLGTNHGQVQRVTDAGVELEEIVADGVGGWVPRSRTLELGGEGSE